jgi:hypothetical protein
MCASVAETSEGNTYVSQPSPGRMAETPLNDPLDAWEDCYSMTPKRRILVARAKTEIQRAWAQWDGARGGPAPMLVFFGWLRRHRPYFLTFRAKGEDPWQTVHSWLLQYERGQR